MLILAVVASECKIKLAPSTIFQKKATTIYEQKAVNWGLTINSELLYH